VRIPSVAFVVAELSDGAAFLVIVAALLPALIVGTWAGRLVPFGSGVAICLIAGVFAWYVFQSLVVPDCQKDEECDVVGFLAVLSLLDLAAWAVGVFIGWGFARAAR
jgi:hypothetical protein